MSNTPGVYILQHPYYANTIKIGSSLDIGRRINDSCYTTMFLDAHKPKLLKYYTVDNYTTTEDVVYIEKSIHRFFSEYRCQANREIFTGLDINLIDIYMNNRQFAYTSSDQPPVPGTKPRIEQQVNPLLVAMEQSEIAPLPHQVPLIQKIVDYYNNSPINLSDLDSRGKSGKFIAPCGYGKMYIALLYLKISSWSNVIILVPSLILSEQYVDIAKKILPDWSIIHFNNTNNIIPETINKKLIIATYQSCNTLNVSNDFVIYDEAHHTCVTSVDETQSSLFRSTLNKWPTANKMFMTATEKMISYDDNDNVSSMWSMDSPIYGDYIVKKGFQEAIEDKIIADYNIVIPDNENTDPCSVIVSAFNELSIHHLLVYSNTCAHSKQINDELVSLGVNSFYLDGKMNKKTRNDILSRFEASETAVLCSVKVLQEGISMPIIDSCYFAEKRTSEIDTTQMVGRALRLHSNKTLATIILPGTMLANKQILSTLIKIDKRWNTKSMKISAISGSKIKTKTCMEKKSMVLNKYINHIKFLCLGKHEGVWNYNCELCLTWEKENPGRFIPHKENIIGKWISHQLTAHTEGKLSPARLECLNGLATWKNKLKKKETTLESVWDEKCKAALEWESDNPDKIFKGKEPVIGQWILSQLTAYNKGKLSSRRLELLKCLRTWNNKIQKKENIRKLSWNEYYELCLQQEKMNPNERIKQSEFITGRWLDRQLVAYNEGKMSPERLRLLNNLRTWRDKMQRKETTHNLTWNESYELCIECEMMNPDRFIKFSDHIVGAWLNHQFTAYNNGKLSDEKIQLLNNLRTWRNKLHRKEIMRKLSWDEYYTLCLEQENINLDKLIYCKDRIIGPWLSRQFTAYNEGNLSFERLQALNNLRTWKDKLQRKQNLNKCEPCEISEGSRDIIRKIINIKANNAPDRHVTVIILRKFMKETGISYKIRDTKSELINEAYNFIINNNLLRNI